MKAKFPLKDVRCYLVDLDGTFYLGSHLLPGAGDFIRVLREGGLHFLFLTNNSSKSGRQYARRIRRFGLDISQEQVFTSGEAAAIYIAKQFPIVQLHVVGTPALEDEFRAHGFHLVQKEPEMVVLGFDTTLTYRKLWRLCDLVRDGIPYIATHHDINCPVEGGVMPDIGAVIAFVKASTGRLPDAIVGKPHRPMLEALQSKLDLPPDAFCMVGDRLYTDIAFGKQGVRTVLVLSGETKVEDLKTSEDQPDMIVQDLGELTSILRAELNHC